MIALGMESLSHIVVFTVGDHGGWRYGEYVPGAILYKERRHSIWWYEANCKLYLIT